MKPGITYKELDNSFKLFLPMFILVFFAEVSVSLCCHSLNLKGYHFFSV